ncbi:DUF2280 domain-containing protein [Sideroxydans lithotrophicus]|uniref:DUF2280 domain-containing protein n=1 Tax=Sideroxydans lithotrophicus (strain ES-1) TaxID=580332 RepID=D5CT66_SIDLE|nr:DUF2280 domain-containing protein [Sideroxydans lithotrophicus]ADE12152.1 Protein of unknown function DUF2280 [Sideroxydans lithotrophicus ES-1]
MAALSDDVKRRIVQDLACFDTPSQVAKAIKAEFGLIVPLQQVEAYQPGKTAAAKLSKRWLTIFEETRKAFLEDTSQVAISHRAVRLRALNRMAAKAEDKGNMALAAQLLEQAAKEVGESYTNRFKHELTGKDGGPIETRKSKDLTDEELAAIAAGGSA